MRCTYPTPLVISPLILVYYLTEPGVRCRALFLLYVEVGELSAYKDIWGTEHQYPARTHPQAELRDYRWQRMKWSAR